MKRNVLASVIWTGIAAFVASGVHANPRRLEPANNPEPYRIYDLASRNFIKNPDYRESVRLKRPAKQSVKRGVDEPQRVYNPMTQQFEDNRGVREPVSRRR